jgi:hypothetical protein
MPFRIFIGSSTEALPIAREMQILLNEDDITVHIWDKYFSAGDILLDALLRTPEECDFACFLYTPDDIVYIRGGNFPAVRDNVIFETGLFMKYLGRGRTIIVAPKLAAENKSLLFSDFKGLLLEEYTPPEPDGYDSDWKAKLGPVCARILKRIRTNKNIEDRSRALIGNWSGKAWQPVFGAEEQIDEFSLKATFNSKSAIDDGPASSSVEGLIEVCGPFGPDIPSLTLIVRGTLVRDIFVRLDWKYKDFPGAIAFGTGILNLDYTGTILEGRFVGVGPFSGGIIEGKISLRREKPNRPIRATNSATVR